ncbi:serine/threonine protein kinase, partial [Aspergillus ruber CBS 135680]
MPIQRSYATNMTRPGLAQKRLISHRFHQIPETPAEDESMIANDVTINIPLDEEDDQQNHDQDRTDAHSKSDSLSFFRYNSAIHNEEGSEKTHLVPDCDASSTGRRRKSKSHRTHSTHTNKPNPNYNYKPSDNRTEHPPDGNKSLTRLRRLYKFLINSSIITRYIAYITPLAILIAIPIIVGATAARYATIGGVTLYWFFAWIEVIWLSLWVCKILARGLPYIFQSLWGVVSPGGRRYGLVLRALEIPISLVGWTGVSLVTFFPIMAHNPERIAHGDTNPKSWEKSVKNILLALFVCSLIFLAEKTMILLISINYHRKQFDSRIRKSKQHVRLLSTLYEASRTMFPMYCKEFYDEDVLICDSMLAAAGGTASSNSSFLRGRAGVIRNVGQNVNRFADQVTEAFGNFAQEITGKHVFNPTAAHSIVTQALERKRSSEALGRRIWMSFVIEGREALFPEDIAEVLGSEREGEAEEAFQLLDRDENGDISLDEIILGVTEIGRMRRALHHSLHDVDQAIQVLDNLLLTVAGIVGVLVFVSFVTSGFGTVIAAGATSLLSLSFVFSTTAQEVLGSCIFLFVKHPFDIGDRVDINGRPYMVERISLLFTVFHCISDHRITQTSNATLNTLWIDNITRADAMHEQLTISVNFNTTFNDIQSLRGEMEAFVWSKDNCRDFQPDVELEVLGVGDDTDRLQLRVDIRHKSNWANESVRASRRSKFMCALVLAMKKLHIRGPGDDATIYPGDDQQPLPPTNDDNDTEKANKRASDTSTNAQIRATQEQGQSTAHLMVPHSANPPTGARTTGY